MYEELYRNWKQELENDDLTQLSSDFYTKLADYVRRLSEESRMLDKRSAKANLLKRETQNAKRMIQELIRTRYKKLVTKATKGEKIPPDVLTIDEEKDFQIISTLSDAFQSRTKEILQGRRPTLRARKELKRAVLRFQVHVPPIIGADMKPYGPFVAEDVASLPDANAKILVNQHLAEIVDIA